MTKEDAQTLRAEQGTMARKLSNMSKAALDAIYTSELAAKGIMRLIGGPASRDEYVNAIMNLRFPPAQVNEAIHVLYHDEAAWSACEHCHPHGDSGCECKLGRQEVAR